MFFWPFCWAGREMRSGRSEKFPFCWVAEMRKQSFWRLTPCFWNVLFNSAGFGTREGSWFYPKAIFEAPEMPVLIKYNLMGMSVIEPNTRQNLAKPWFYLRKRRFSVFFLPQAFLFCCFFTKSHWLLAQEEMESVFSMMDSFCTTGRASQLGCYVQQLGCMGWVTSAFLGLFEDFEVACRSISIFYFCFEEVFGEPWKNPKPLGLEEFMGTGFLKISSRVARFEWLNLNPKGEGNDDRGFSFCSLGLKFLEALNRPHLFRFGACFLRSQEARSSPKVRNYRLHEF